MNTFYDPLTNRILTKRPDAYLIDEVFSEDEFAILLTQLSSIEDSMALPYDRWFGRFGLNSTDRRCPELLSNYHDKLLPLARKLFSPTLEPSYCLWASYRGYRAQLPKHIDDNACTYTIDLCLSHVAPWSIYIEGKELIPYPNQAVVYYGEDQYHWREAFTEPNKNRVDMIFFHFVEPQHWWFTKGPQYIDKITNDRDSYQKNKGMKRQ